MKTWKKILLGVILTICVMFVLWLLIFIAEEKKIKEYSTYCMDTIRSELWENLENIDQIEVFEFDWAYVYLWSLSYEWANYIFSCSVKNKDDVEINKLQQVYDSTPAPFVSYYDNWAIRETWTYVDWMRQWVWTTYDEEWNVIDMQEYRNWRLMLGEGFYDFTNDEKLLSLYPDLNEQNWNIIPWDTLQTNYVNWTNNIYYDPYRGIIFKVWEEFDWWLIREVDTDETWYPIQEIILLVKWEENEENRTGINGFREILTITAISKENLRNFGVEPDFMDRVIWENNQYYFVWNKSDENHYSDLIFFDVEN